MRLATWNVNSVKARLPRLLEWLDEAKLARVGCFKYEPVEGAAANSLGNAVPEEVKEERWRRLMAAQQNVSRALMAAKVARIVDVIVERWQQFTGKDARLEADGRTFAAAKAERVGQTV